MTAIVYKPMGRRSPPAPFVATPRAGGGGWGTHIGTQAKPRRAANAPRPRPARTPPNSPAAADIQSIAAIYTAHICTDIQHIVHKVVATP